MGPTYYMRLKHMVKDKINYRARGPNQMLTRQAVQGRANDGGLRVGEMERDGICAHGLAYFLNESFLIRGDEYYMAICNKTGAISIYNEAKNLFLSPYSDGPINFHTNPDGTMNIKNLSKFGRSFSLLRIPYTFKLLIQELQVLNIQMRIITDENVDQLLSMSYSNNISKLLHKPETRNTTDNKIMVMNYVRMMNKDSLRKPDETDDRDKIPNTPEFPTPLEEHDIASKSPEYVQQESPAYNPSGSPAYNPSGSPAYNPSGSPEYVQQGSPAYNPSGSPAYNPSLSPEYVQQGSPAYNPSGSPAPQPETPSDSPATTVTTSVTPAEIVSPPSDSILNVQEEEKPEVDANKTDSNNSSEIKKIDITNTTI
jgi:hypothetical protein